MKYRNHLFGQLYVTSTKLGNMGKSTCFSRMTNCLIDKWCSQHNVFDTTVAHSGILLQLDQEILLKVLVRKTSWLKTCLMVKKFIWTASSEIGTYRICEQRRFRRACASAQSRQNLRCSLIQALSQEEPSDRKPDLWPLWMAGHVQLKFVMTECSKTQNRLTRLILW